MCEYSNHRINVYNNTWDRVSTIERYGSDDGELYRPISAVVSDENSIIISDYWNDRVSEFSFNGTFLRQLVDRSDGTDWPYSMSYYYPYLWLVQNDSPRNKVHRYNLYG